MKEKLNCILLIDDDEDDNFFHTLAAKESGVTYDIKVAENAVVALDYLKKANSMPQLIFIDINMPKMNGWEFVDEYKKLKLHHPDTVIIMLTTSLNPVDKEKSKFIPEIKDFMTKPLNAGKISEVFKNYF